MSDNHRQKMDASMDSQLTQGERSGVAILLLVIALIIVWDLVNDFLGGGSGLHLLVEGVLALAALWGAKTISGRYLFFQRQNEELKVDMERIQASEKKWREDADRHIRGLSEAIDAQFVSWGLTPAEKEVALLLLKGLSLKEISQIRGGSERTARQHSLMVYQKSGLGGRAELAAFFLEDLLTPRS